MHVGHKWTHVIFVLNQPRGTLKFYCNGKFVQNLTLPANASATSRGNLYIGHYYRDGIRYRGGFFTGIIDELVIYRRVLSSTEILSLYQRGARGLELRKP